MMAEGNAQSRYVKLTKEQMVLLRIFSLESLISLCSDRVKVVSQHKCTTTPYTALFVQLPGRKCHECGQTLPESYQPPGDEPWTTGIFGCLEDSQSCWAGLFCPCVLFGHNVESSSEDDTPWTGPCICHAIFVEGGLALAVATALLAGVIDPGTTFLITEGLLFSWWMCGVYTGIVRTNLQKKYHLKVISILLSKIFTR